jgi:MscS family membrane protein
VEQSDFNPRNNLLEDGMSGLLSKTFYGNTVDQWLIAFAIMIGAAIVGKALYWFFANIGRRLTSKTKTKLDDLIIDMIEEPIVVAATLFGIWKGLDRLVFPDETRQWIAYGMEGLIILSVTWLLARLMDSLIREYLVPLAEKSETDLDDQLLPIFRRGAKASIWVLGIIVALNNAGYQIGPLIAGLGIGGLALAMAAKDTVSNVFGGFTIFTDRPFTINDRIKFSGFDGNVEEIGLRSTRVRTLGGTLVTVPNAKFADSPVENVSAEPSRKVVVNLGLTYDTTPAQMQDALATLRAIAEANENLEEKVVTGFTDWGDFAMGILFVYYIKSGADIIGTQSEINLAILEQFNAKGLEFAFPTQTVYHQALPAS